MKTKIEYSLECLPEDVQIKGNCSAIDPATDAQTENWIQDQLAQGNEWAWCCVKVTCKLTRSGKTFTGVDYLGGCSYENEEAFRVPGGYFDDMKAQALADALQQINDAIVRGSIAKEIQTEINKEMPKAKATGEVRK